MTDLLTYGTTRLMEELPQLPGEPSQAYMAFLTWVKAGTPEPKDLSSLTGFSSAAIKIYQERHRWQERLDESPYGLQASVVKNRIAEQVRAYSEQNSPTENIVNLIQRQIVKCLVADSLTEEPVVRPADLASLLTAVHNYERLEAGKSTENVAVADRQRPNLEGMSVEELRTLKQALPKLFEESPCDDES